MLAPHTRLKERYRILHKIGGGGFGHVYKAVDEVFDCSVAIKETREEVAQVEKLRKAFEREAKLLRNLKHDSLPRVTDYFFEDHAQFLVMDFINGEDLAARLNERLRQYQRPFTSHEILPWFDNILAALEYLHSRPEPIIHRDIKPANIKLTDEGEIYLLDFGLAKGAAGQMSTIIDGQVSSSVPGCTREYAPLEQLQETGTMPQSDIYALGATLYHLLTGQLPPSASRRNEAIQRGQADPLRPPHTVNPAIPLGVSQIISQSLFLLWWERIGSAREMRTALARAHENIGAAPHGSEVQPVAQTAQPDSQAWLATLPLEQSQETPPSSHGESLPSARTSARLSRLRHSWFVRGFALFVLVSLAAVVWFAVQRPPTQTLQVTHGTPIVELPAEFKPPEIATPINLELKTPLSGHKGAVWSVAFSPDGSLIASASEDATIIVRDARTWEPKFRPLTGHTGAIYSVAFSPDQKILASGGRDKTIRLWDIQNGTLLKALPQEHLKSVLRLAFSPAGDILASSSGDPNSGGEEIRLWYPHNAWESAPLEEQLENVFAIAFSPDSSTLACAGYGKAVRLWNLRDAKQSVELRLDKPPEEFVTTLAFSTDGKYLACGGSDKIIRLWLYRSQTQRWEESPKPFKKEHKNFITSISFSPDNKTLASASLDNTVRLWNVETGSSRLLLNPGEILMSQRSVAFSPDGQTLITGGKDKMVRIWQ